MMPFLRSRAGCNPPHRSDRLQLFDFGFFVLHKMERHRVRPQRPQCPDGQDPQDSVPLSKGGNTTERYQRVSTG
jgi:hypothetical protein